MKNQFDLDCLIFRIEELCTQKHMSVKSVLEDCGLSRVAVDNMKKGSVPSIDKIFILANYFNVSVDYLLGKKNDDNNFIVGEMSNVNNNVMGNHNSVSGLQPRSKEKNNEYDEIINYFDSLPIRERRRAKVAVIEYLEDNFPKKKET